MKPGCFIKILLVSTVLFAITFYIVKNKGKEWIEKPVKSMVLKEADAKVLSLISDAESLIVKDSIISVWEEFKVTVLDSGYSVNGNSIAYFTKKLDSLREVKTLTLEDIKDLRNILFSHLEKEGSVKIKIE
ncbi:MAG: hypothetical protein IAE91_07850 [Ignavibacteriaceae bacterium]|nr:hypothetical protein [Ignavibacteriaceae bacterium]